MWEICPSRPQVKQLQSANTMSLASLMPSCCAQMGHLWMLHQPQQHLDRQPSKEVAAKLLLLGPMCSSSSLLRNSRQSPQETSSNSASSSWHSTQPSNKQVASNSSRQLLLQRAKRMAQT